MSLDDQIKKNEQRAADKARELFNARIPLWEKEQQLFRKAKDLEWHNKFVEAKAADERYLYYFGQVMEMLPEEKRTEVHDFLAERMKQINEARYNSIRQLAQQNPSFTDQMRKYFLIYRPPEALYKSDALVEAIALAVKGIETEKLDTLIASADSFQPPAQFNVRVHIHEKRIAQQKELNAQNIKDPQTLSALNAELDEINDLVLGSTTEYGSLYGDQLDSIYESMRCDRYNRIFNNMIEQPENQFVKDCLLPKPEGGYQNISGFRTEKVKELAVPKVVTADAAKMKLSPSLQNSLRDIIAFMKERNMLSPFSTSGEKGRKTYGFTQICEAHFKLEKALGSTSVEEIRAAKAEYKQAVENMRDLYRLIEEKLHPSTEMQVGNINSFRENWVPAEFKDNMTLNSITNGIYNLAISLQNGGVEIDELCRDPSAALVNIIKNTAQKSSPDALGKNQSFSATMMDFLTQNERSKYPNYGVARNAEILTQLSYNDPENEQNIFGSFLIASYDSYVSELILNEEFSSMAKYLSTNPTATISNLFLVNEADRDYNKLRSFEAISVDATENIPPFNALDYMESHKVNALDLNTRIQSTLADIVAQMKKGGAPLIKNDHAIEALQGAQIAAYTYLKMQVAPASKEEATAYANLQKIVKDPAAAFKSLLSQSPALKEDFKAKPSIRQLMEQREKTASLALNEARANEHLAASETNRQVGELMSTLEALAAQAPKTQNDINSLNQRITETYKALDALQVKETDRLEKAYQNGEIPRDYYVERVRNVAARDFDKFVPFGVEERPSFGDFKKQYTEELKAGELSKKEVRMLYDRMLENAKSEETRFLLVSAKLQPRPRNVSIQPQNAEPEKPAAEQKPAEKEISVHEDGDRAVGEEEQNALATDPSATEKNAVNQVSIDNERERIIISEVMDQNPSNVSRQIEKTKVLKTNMKEI